MNAAAMSRRHFLAAAALPLVGAALSRGEVGTARSTLVLGIGGGGSNAARHLRREGFSTRYRTLNREGEGRRDDSVGSIPVLPNGVAYADAYPRWETNPHLTEHVAAAMEDAGAGVQRVVLLVGLGGLTGTSVAPLAAAYLGQRCRTVVVCSTPFHFEGADRMRNASRGQHALAAAGVDVVTIDLQDVLGHARRGSSFTELLETCDRRMAAAARGFAAA